MSFLKRNIIVSCIPIQYEGSLRNVVGNVLGCDLKESEFEIHSRYYVPFWTSTMGKGMNFFILPRVSIEHHCCPPTWMALR